VHAVIPLTQQKKVLCARWRAIGCYKPDVCNLVQKTLMTLLGACLDQNVA
jgi:hypothetical protein